MCEGSCNCKKEITREDLVDILNSMYAKQEQLDSDISRAEADLAMLDEATKYSSEAYKVGSMLKATVDGFEDAGFTKDQAFAIMISFLGAMKIEVNV